MISQTAEHALRAVVFLARSPGVSVPATGVAAAIGAPANYLGKTLQTLARHGFVIGTRGKTGGFRLAVDASRVSVADIAAVFSDRTRSKICLLGGTPCSDAHACIAHQRWGAMHNALARTLEGTTVADLIGEEAQFTMSSVPHPTARVAV